MSGAREQVSRLLALVPYLQTRDRRVAGRRSPPTSGSEPDQISKDLKVLWMCGLPGLTPGQDDRRRLRGDRGRSRGRRPHRQRRLPRPPGPARQLRGLGPDRGAACPARGQSGRLARGDRPLPGQAGGRRRDRDRGAAGRGAPAALGTGAAATPRCSRRRSRPTARPGSTTTCRPATRPPQRTVDPLRAAQRATGTTTSTPGATSPGARDCSGSTGCTPSRWSTSRARSTT